MESEESNDIWIYAHDYSGSTASVESYFAKAREYLAKFNDIIKEQKNFHYVLWGTECNKTDLTNLLRVYDAMEGPEGTLPSTIAQWIIDNGFADKNIHLWLITDGEIYEEELVQCKNLNYGINYKTITLVTINEINIDNSVSFAFFNNDCVITIYEEIGDTFKKIDLETTEYDFSVINYDNFIDKYDALLNFAISKYTVSYDKLTDIDPAKKFLLEQEVMAFVENLKKKKLELVDEYRRRNPNEVLKDLTTFESFGKNKVEVLENIKFLSFYTETVQGVQTFEGSVVAKIDSLISFVHNTKKGSYSFSELKRNIHQQKFDEKTDQDAKEVPEVDPKDLSSAVNFQDCFSLCESNSPIICFDKNNFIVEFVQENYQFYIQIIDYPFVLIDHKDFLQKNTFICQAYDSNNFKQYINVSNGARVFPIDDPLTRAQLIGGIIPYEFADAWNDYSISCIFLKGKKVKKSFYDLFYFVLSKKLEEIESIDHSVAHQLKIYALERIKKGKSKLTFSSLPTEPMEQVPTPIALFYCVQLSTELFGEDPAFFKMEKLRNFCFTSRHIIEILLHYKMDLNLDMIQKRSELFEYLNHMKSMNDYEKLNYILGLIFKVQDGVIINEILHPEMIKTIKYIHQNLNEPVKLKNDDLTLESLKDNLHFFYAHNKPIYYTVCEKTCRPFYLFNGQPYHVELMKEITSFTIKNNAIKESTVEVLEYNKVLSICHIFVNYVSTFKEYPTFGKFKEYLLIKKKKYAAENSKVLTCVFAINVFDDIRDIYDLYQPIADKIPVAKFIELARKSVNVNAKIVMEK